MMSNKPKNDRYSVDEKHLDKELKSVGIHNLPVPIMNAGVTYGNEPKFGMSCSRCYKWKAITENEFMKLEGIERLIINELEQG